MARRPNPESPGSVSGEMSAVAADTSMMGAPVDPASRTGVDPSRRLLVGDHAVVGADDDFDLLFATHYQRLVRALTIVAGDAETAADAVQEAFVKAHLRWRRIGGYDDPIGWVRRVAINRLRDEHRRRGRKRHALSRLALRTETTTAPAEIDEFDRLLAELPKQQRAATALFYVDGLAIAEIAAALDIAEGSVKSHLHDARRRLRPVLEREVRRADGNEKVGNDE